MSSLSPLIGNLPSLAANLIIGALGAIVIFFMLRVCVVYLYQPIFGDLKAFPENEASPDPKLLKEIQQRIEESKRAQETPQNSPRPDPFD